MKRNESDIDRGIRALLSVALVIGGFIVGGWLAYVLYALAAVLVVTGLFAFCPLYALLHIDTCKMSKSCTS